MEFNSLTELKERVMPALRLRRRNLKKENIIMSEDEIWNYLAENYWKNSFQLSLAKMVDDILNRDIYLSQTEYL